MKEIKDYFESLKEVKYYSFPKTYVDERGHERQVMGEVEYKPVITPDGKKLKDFKLEPTYTGLAMALGMTVKEMLASDNVEIKKAMMFIDDRFERKIRLEGNNEALKNFLDKE